MIKIQFNQNCFNASVRVFKKWCIHSWTIKSHKHYKWLLLYSKFILSPEGFLLIRIFKRKKISAFTWIFFFTRVKDYTYIFNVGVTGLYDFPLKLDLNILLIRDQFPVSHVWFAYVCSSGRSRAFIFHFLSLSRRLGRGLCRGDRRSDNSAGGDGDDDDEGNDDNCALVWCEPSRRRWPS